MARSKWINFEIATQIRQEYIAGETALELAEKYNFSERGITSIIANKRWRDPDYTKPERRTTALTQEQFIEKSNKIHNFEYDYSKSIYLTVHDKVIIICSLHGEFQQTPGSHMQGTGCRECAKKNMGAYHKLNNADIDLYLSTNSPKILRIENYINDSTPIQFKCQICDHIWKTTTSHIKNGTACPNCSRFKNEKLVRDFLVEHHIEYASRNIKINNKRIYPDFYLPKYNLYIEYNGDQHYKPVCFGGIIVLPVYF